MRAFILIAFIAVTFVCFINQSLAQNEESNHIPSILLESALSGDVEGIHRAMQAGENIDVTNDKGWSAARFAVALGDLTFLHALIDAGIDLNNADHEGVTPLMAAAGEGDREAVEVLLNGNASPLQRAADGGDAYTHAEAAGRKVNALLIAEAASLHALNNDDLAAVVESINRGSYVNIRNQAGWTPLILAAARGNVDAVKTILAAGADPNRTENDNWTALHFAADSGHDKVVDELLKGGARFDLRNNNDKTARELAMDHNFLTIVDRIPDLKSEF